MITFFTKNLVISNIFTNLNKEQFMTTEQMIEEILLEADGLGIRQMVLEECEKYMDDGMSRIDAIEAAFSELVEEMESDEDLGDLDAADWDAIELGYETWGDDDDEYPEDDTDIVDEYNDDEY